MEAIAVLKHFFDDVSDVSGLIAWFVFLDKVCIFVDSAPVKPKRNLKFSAKGVTLFDVFHANRLPTDVIACEGKHN